MILTRYLFVLFAIAVCGCSTHSLNVSDEQSEKTLKVCEQFYGYLKKDNYDSARACFSKEFYRLYSKDELAIMMNEVKAEKGSVRNSTLIQTRVSINVDGGEKEKVISNVYKVLYSTGFLANEEFSFIQGADNDGFSKIDGYAISPYVPEN